MKKLIFSTVLCLAFVAASAQENAKPVGGTGPMIQIDKEVHDYGTVAQGGDGNCEFVVTNTGDQPLILTNCKGSCGCTVPKCDTEPIKPGGKSTITVHYDTKRVGPINKSVTVSSNATNSPEKILRIKGTVEGAPAPADGSGTPAAPAPGH
ncbi:MAG: DUF1573 domain-containing protein [Flavobacteriales bacterium]